MQEQIERSMLQIQTMGLINGILAYFIDKIDPIFTKFEYNQAYV